MTTTAVRNYYSSRRHSTTAATDKQMAFLGALLRDWAQVDPEAAAAHERQVRETVGMSMLQASAQIELVKSFRDAARQRKVAEVVEQVKPAAAAPVERVSEPGMYRDADGNIFKVQRSRQSGNLYAKALTPIGGQRLTEDDTVVRWEFTYAAGAIYRLSATNRMSLEDAQAFGIKYGVCCVCGATLKDATSVAQGIGPVCGGRV